MEEMQSRIKMSDGFGVFCRRWRPEQTARSTVICLHGIEVHSGAFGFVGPELARDGSDVYAFDRRGFGNSNESDLPRGDTRSFKRHLADLDEVVQGARKDNPGTKLFLFGHSIGCAYALWYAANYPDSIDGMVLAAAPIDVGFKVPAKDAVKFPFLKLFSPHSMYNLLDRWPEEFKRSEEFKLITADDLCTGKFGVGWLLSLQTGLANKMLQNSSKLTKPALVLQGDSDIIALPSGVKKLNERMTINDKSFREFKGADHWFYHAIIPRPSARYELAKKKEVSSAIAEWLSAH